MHLTQFPDHLINKKEEEIRMIINWDIDYLTKETRSFYFNLSTE